MVQVKNTDCEGNSVTCVEHKGRFYPPRPDMELHLDTLEEFKARSDDVWIMSFPKCGTHWCWDIVAMLQSGKVHYHKEVKEKYMLEFNKMDHYETISSPRVLNSHLLYTELPKSIFEKKSKMIQVVRNPKDASVSFYNHFRGIAAYGYDGSFKGFFDLIMRDKIEYGQWFDYVTNWWEKTKNDENVLWLTYEDMILDLPKHVKEIAEFIGVEASGAIIEQVAEACTFSAMKKAKNEADLKYYNWKDGFQHGMYRKGKVGDWKDWYTVAQSEFFDSVYNDKMKNHLDLKAKIKFEL